MKLAYIKDHGKIVNNKDQVQIQQKNDVVYNLELLLLLPNVSYNSSKIFCGAKTFSNFIGAWWCWRWWWYHEQPYTTTSFVLITLKSISSLQYILLLLELDPCRFNNLEDIILGPNI